MALYVIFDTRDSYITQLHADDDTAARSEVTGMLRRRQPVGHVHRLDKGPDGSGEDWTDVTAAVLDPDEARAVAAADRWELEAAATPGAVQAVAADALHVSVSVTVGGRLGVTVAGGYEYLTALRNALADSGYVTHLARR